MIVQLGVLIRLKADSMTRACRSRQKRRRCAAVQVVDDVVTGGSQFTREARSCHHATAFEHDHIVNVRMIRKQRRNPILDEYVDLRVRQKSFQREE